MFVFRPITMGATSPRTTALYQMLAPSEIVTSPIIMAPGAIKTSSAIVGQRPLNGKTGIAYSLCSPLCGLQEKEKKVAGGSLQANRLQPSSLQPAAAGGRKARLAPHGIAHHKYQVSRAFGHTAHQIGVPLRTVGNVDAHLVALAHQFLL